MKMLQEAFQRQKRSWNQRFKAGASWSSETGRLFGGRVEVDQKNDNRKGYL